MYRHIVPVVAVLLMAAAPPSELSPDGLPPLTFGMTVAQAGKALGKPLKVDYADPSKACGQVLDPRYRTTSLMFVDGKLARIDVRRRGLSFQGISVGATEAEVRVAFPKLRVEPHKYTNGQYLNVKLSPTTGVVFETDKTKVTRFRLGTYPAVEFVEGCY
jgi:hypothetical protein